MKMTAVMSPETPYGIHRKKTTVEHKTLNLNQKRKIQMGDKVTIKLDGITKTYIMMKTPRGSFTELTKACLGHSIGDKIIYQNNEGRILGIK